MNQQLVLFDYNTLDTSTREYVEQRTEEIKVLVRKTAEDIWHIGRKLTEVKGKLGHGNFGNWLDTEFGWDHTSAWRFMNVNSKFCNLQNLQQFAPSALYLLAAPSTPDDAREDALRRAEAGEPITHAKAREIVDEHKEKPSPERLRERAELFERWSADNAKIGFDEFGDPLPSEPKETQPENNGMAVHFSSETDQHNTPPEIIERVMGVLGHIDLDPCSNDGAPNVQEARKHYTKSDDGLSQEWIGRVYMNPPYGRGIVQWVEKLCAEYDAGRTTEAIALVPSRTDTKWFRKFRNYPRCFLWGRLTFGDAKNTAPFPSMAVYLGSDIDGFLCAFSDIGDVYEYTPI